MPDIINVLETELRNFNTEDFTHKIREQQPEPRNDQQETEDNETMTEDRNPEDCDNVMEHMEEGENMNDNDFSRASAGIQFMEDETLRALIALGGAAIPVRTRRTT
eukprot:2670126-Heterocapsa_arctica.AAC.1